MRTTGRAIVEGAFTKLGLLGQGQNLGGNDLEFGMRALNELCEELRLGPSFATTHAELVVPYSGAASVTIGVGQTVNADVPERIEIGSFTRIGAEDLPLQPVDLAAYNSVTQKTTGGARPVAVYLDRAVPVGRLYFWPPVACEAHLVVRSHVGQFAAPGTEYDLPTGFKSLLTFTLAERIGPDYEVAVSDDVKRTAANLRRTVRRGNLVVPQLDVGAGTGYSAEAAFLGGD